MIDFENISLTDARTKLAKIADIVEGTIDHCDLDDAMDLLYQVKAVVERDDMLINIKRYVIGLEDISRDKNNATFGFLEERGFAGVKVVKAWVASSEEGLVEFKYWGKDCGSCNVERYGKDVRLWYGGMPSARERKEASWE